MGKLLIICGLMILSLFFAVYHLVGFTIICFIMALVMGASYFKLEGDWD